MAAFDQIFPFQCSVQKWRDHCMFMLRYDSDIRSAETGLSGHFYFHSALYNIRYVIIRLNSTLVVIRQCQCILDADISWRIESLLIIFLFIHVKLLWNTTEMTAMLLNSAYCVLIPHQRETASVEYHFPRLHLLRLHIEFALPRAAEKEKVINDYSSSSLLNCISE